MLILSEKNLNLRSIKVEDALFLYNLRTHKALSKYLNPVYGSVKDQKKYIIQSQNKKNLEYYFIIEYKNKAVGTVRIYNINYNDKTFEWGSWMIVSGNPITVALGSVYLSYHFAFYYLNLNKAYINVKLQNKSAFKFYIIFSNHIYSDNELYCLEYIKENFKKFINLYYKKTPIFY